MELSARYAYQIYLEKSFSAAAKRLYISQPALSASVARLETELGFRIFDRSTVPVSLTPSGRIYIESLEEIMESEQHMRRRIQQLTEFQSEHLAIGASSYSSYFLIPALTRAFARQYPHVRFLVNMASTRNANLLHDELKQQTLDVLIVYTFNEREHLVTPLLRERMIIAMHKDLPGAKALAPYAVTAEELLRQTYPPEKELEDFSPFRKIPFFRFSKGSLSYQYMAKILGDYAVTPHTISHMPHHAMHYNMMCAGLGALMTTDTMVRLSPMNTRDLLFFVPKSSESYRYLYLVRQAERPLSPVVRDFIAMASRLCADDQWLSLVR